MEDRPGNQEVLKARMSIDIESATLKPDMIGILPTTFHSYGYRAAGKHTEIGFCYTDLVFNSPGAKVQDAEGPG